MGTSGGVPKLGPGSRIGVIGGGPSGSLFAHFSHRLADRLGISVQVMVFEAKRFDAHGPAGCNMGAGIISESVLRLLSAEGFDLPEETIQRRIHGYHVQLRDHCCLLTGPAGRGEIASVNRGAGPPFATEASKRSFDEFVLSHVLAEGKGAVSVIREPVEDLIIPDQPGELPSVGCGRTNRRYFELDLVVGAFGLNTTLTRKVEALGFGYRPPRTIRACQMALPMDPAYIANELGDDVQVFLSGKGEVRFGILTPKAAYVTVSLVGSRDLTMGDLLRFLEEPAVRAKLPPAWRQPDKVCYCFPRLAVGAAVHPYADRFVIVGDAAYSRYYKNGLESAFMTARLAAESAFAKGLSGRAFADGYGRPARQLFVGDNSYGRRLFALNDFAARSGFLAEVWVRLLSRKTADERTDLMRRILWATLTGAMPYRQIFWQATSPRVLMWVLATAAGLLVEKTSGLLRAALRMRE